MLSRISPELETAFDPKRLKS
jgi:hypothetical protein